MRIITSGDRIEIYKMNNYAARMDFTREIEIVENEEEEKQQSLKDRKATLNKARNNIMRLISANPDMTTFITLTFANEHDIKNSKKLLNVLFTQLRKEYWDLKYLWVLELGEKHKRLHYHILCNIYIPIKLSSNKEVKSKIHKKYEEEFRKSYWPYGFIDIRCLDQENNTNIALYVSAYIVKSLFEVSIDGRVYGYSRKTLIRPVETKIYSNDNLEQILNLFSDYKVVFSNSYKIGFTDWKGERRGEVTYLDMIKNK